ncbi:hypothetical protein M413DRAFT_408512 [Hebeloma cylindrosporum]|uniref:Uncharacterized protein n=1 Tax=Hebeloma cylindrosporum TaxID=76867 RepID=A0A0C2XYD3_HEBCY|nr:hypothetical protein M413DRAFT_408512 [Hebeloma cylindrosporum h7]
MPTSFIVLIMGGVLLLFTYKEAAWIRRLTPQGHYHLQPPPPASVMFLPSIHHHRTRVSLGDILKVSCLVIHSRSKQNSIKILPLKSTSQICSPMASFHSTFHPTSLLPSSPITLSYYLTSIKITFWNRWTITLPRTSWQSLVRIAFRSTWFSLLHLLRIRRLDATYSNQLHEDRYWKEAAGGQRDLQRSDARFVGEGVRNPKNPAPYVPPLVMYYTPALLPEYRDSQTRKETGKGRRSKSYRGKDVKQVKKPECRRKLKETSNNNTQEHSGDETKGLRYFHVTPRAYRKWHYMVFPGSEHPTISEAARLRKLHCPSELRMIHQISQSLTDREVFDHPEHKPLPKASEYQKRWNDWRASEECIAACIEYNSS